MPNYSPIQLFSGSTPYLAETDNLPLVDTNVALEIINDAVDSNSSVLQLAQGTAGNLATRLDVSLNSDGSLQTTAVDNCLHHIAAHLDDGTYCRMLIAERDKLSNIADNSTNLSVQFDCISNTVLIDDGLFEIQDSNTVQWTVSDSNKFQAQVVYQPTGHFYNITPTSSDHVNFNAGAAFISGTLRIYINGSRIGETPGNYIPTNITSSLEWEIRYYMEENSSLGTFSLNAAISVSDVILIDFDTALV